MTRTGSVSYDVSVRHSIDPKRVQDLITGAFEGGSNYWLGGGRVELVTPAYDDLPKDGVVWYGNSKRNVFAEPFIITIDVPDDKLRRLTPDSIRKALRKMARDYPRDLADILDENDDGSTSDTFLQLALFGEIVYG